MPLLLEMTRSELSQYVTPVRSQNRAAALRTGISPPVKATSNLPQMASSLNSQTPLIMLDFINANFTIYKSMPNLTSAEMRAKSPVANIGLHYSGRSHGGTGKQQLWTNVVNILPGWSIQLRQPLYSVQATMMQWSLIHLGTARE